MKRKKATAWRDERQLRGVQSRVRAALNVSRDGAYVEIEIKTALAVVEIIKQARMMLPRKPDLTIEEPNGGLLGISLVGME